MVRRPTPSNLAASVSDSPSDFRHLAKSAPDIGGDRREYVLDLTGLIARSQHFAPLMEDADMFAKIDIVDDGLGVAWPVETKWGHLDLSGSTLRRMAEEQLLALLHHCDVTGHSVSHGLLMGKTG